MKKKINILCVEDGAVDLKKVFDTPLDDVMGLVYKKGREKPYILTLEIDKRDYKRLKRQVTENNFYKELYKKMLYYDFLKEE